jgi:dihydroorotase
MTGPAANTLYVNARLLDPATGLDAPGGLLVRGGTIARLGPDVGVQNIPADVDIIDCKGHCLAPGLIDSRVFVGEPGAEHKENFISAGQAAAAGGVTTILTMPNTKPVIDGVSLVESIARRRPEDILVRVRPIAAATKKLEGEEITEIGLLKSAGAVAFTDGRKAVSNAGVMAKLLKYARMFDALIVQHAEEPTLSTGVMNAGELATRLGLPASGIWGEVIMVDRDIRLVEATGARLHFGQISTAAALDVIRRMRGRGMPVSCAVTPPHFMLNELAVGDYRTFAKISPPLRSEEDRQSVIEALKDGTISVIASGHDPQDPESKRLPFAQAAFGAVGLETLLPLSLSLHHNGHMKLLDVIDKLTRRPADLYGLDGGRLAPGKPADLVIFDPDAAIRITASTFRSKSKNTPFDEYPSQGRVMRTVVGGRTVFEA